MNRNATRRRDAESRRDAEKRGRMAERLALLMLRVKGYSILEERYKTTVGEIDIIARKGDILVFAEVKARQDTYSAAESIGPRQRQRIADAAATYLAGNPEVAELTCRFDAILVAPGSLPVHIADAWQLD